MPDNARSANEKLSIAVLGVGGRGRANLNSVRSENIVALCDVNEKNLKAAGCPEADKTIRKVYRDGWVLNG